MLNPDAKLVENVLDKSKLEMIPTRDGYGKGLVKAGEKDERVVVLCADLTESTRSLWFAEKFPERFIEIGVAEQNIHLLRQAWQITVKFLSYLHMQHSVPAEIMNR